MDMLLIHTHIQKLQILGHTSQDKKAVPHAGHKLIELQRAQLEPYFGKPVELVW